MPETRAVEHAGNSKQTRDAMRKIPIYLYRGPDGAIDPDRKWGTLDAIFNLDGCTPIGRSGRPVDPDLLDEDGFLPYGLSPDEL